MQQSFPFRGNGKGLHYLGNITHQVNTSNTVVVEYNFDAWGRRRSADDWSFTLDANDLALFADRGFTSHEYLSWFNLYNMNGRLYDPLVARFISPDPFMQAPNMTQSMNRYTYCMNNPLVYVDYNGYTWFSKLGNWIDKNANQIITVAATVVVVAAVTVATAGMGTPLLAAAIVGGAGGFTSGAASTWLNGGNFMQGLGAGAINGVIGAAAGMAGGAFSAWATKGLGGALLGQLNVKASSAIGGLVTGVIGGYAGGFATGLISTGDFGKAFDIGLSSGEMGAIIGASMNGIRGFRTAAPGSNPWTGNARSNDMTKAFGLDETLKRISNGEAYPHRNDGSIFRNKEGILPDKSYGGYKEYVHPTTGSQGPGVQRIVIGNGGEIYYSQDHYETFIKIP